MKNKDRRKIVKVIAVLMTMSLLSACASLAGADGMQAAGSSTAAEDSVSAETRGTIENLAANQEEISAGESADAAEEELETEMGGDGSADENTERSSFLQKIAEKAKIQTMERPSMLGGAMAVEENEGEDFEAALPRREETYRLEDLSNQDDCEYLSDEVKTLLEENGFAVVEGFGYEFYEQYEYNRYSLTPNFVTVDSLMHTYHLFFTHLMKKTEKNSLYPELKELSYQMMEKSLDQYEILKGTEWEEAAGRAVGFFSVALGLADTAPALPDGLSDPVWEELELIEAQDGIAVSPLLGIDEDYSQYKPRGYYDTDEALSAYFQTMMWYGRMNFTQREEELDRTALLILLLMDEDTLPMWEHIYTVTSFFAGQSDDAGYYEFRPVIDAVYGEAASAKDLIGEEGLWEQYHKLTGEIPAPSINSMPIYNEAIEPDRDAAITGYRFMGQRFTLDADIFQNLIYRSVKENEKGEYRMLPDPLDVPAAFGSEEAMAILEENGETQYLYYKENMENMQEEIAEKDSSFWGLSLYNGWLHTILPLLEEKGEGYPAFMQTKAWVHKNLSSFLGSWAELKHDTILYGKQPMAEMGGGWEETKDDRGYVEPEPVVFARLSALSDATLTGLKKLHYLSDEDELNLLRLSRIADQLEIIAKKELSGELPTEDEFELIRTFGGQLEHFWYDAVKDQKDSEFIRAEEFPSAIVADVATDPQNGLCLEVGTGGPATIYVIVEVDGVPRLAEGAVFSFYSFEQPISDRLTDTQWRLKMGIEPNYDYDSWEHFYDDRDPVDPPEWTKDYMLKNRWWENQG